MSFDIVGHLKIVDNATRPLRAMTAGILKFGAAAAGIGAAVGTVAVIGDSLKKAIDFESQLQSIKALTGATDASMAKINALALEQGALTKYSALESAQAIEELLKAGMSEATIMSGGLNAALNLATAGGLELAEAAETMATSMNAFKKDGLSAAQTADILAGTANAAATDVRNIAYGIASAGGVADMAGISFRDLNTAIGLMSNDGLKSGSDAGTSFKSMLMYLQPQTKKATAMFNQLGIGVGKANKFFEGGKIKDLAGIAEVLNKTLGKMNNQDRVATLLDMFGTDGVKAATTLYKAGAKGVEEFHNEMAKVTALQVAEEKMNSAAGAIEQFQGAMETLQISAMSPLLPYIKKFALGAQEMIAQWTPQITASIQNAVDSAASYINTHFINNPQFQSLPDIPSKIKFIFEDISKTFEKWLNAGGTNKIEEMSRRAIDILAGYLKASQPLIEAAMTLGTQVGVAITKGMAQGIGNLLIGDKGIEVVQRKFSDEQLVRIGGKLPDNIEKPDASGAYYAGNKALGHSGGLDYVPYSGYTARLHQGEEVLTATEARNRREDRGSSGGNSAPQITIHATIREDADIQKLARELSTVLAQ